ncbi:hypothetical protein FQN55_002492 [Onygenales sp. PD_40]|nr:hypothetical protein FQN55_002492 [Onygenales sp. PD_40]KAK2803116.1 hypothetical protein FQN51_003860 [Onygenales sp. PD_10]
MPHIVVIGAGVIGLQTALFLLEAGYKVTIIAEHFPGDLDALYTSPWAGGQWRSHASPGQKQCDWDLQTFEYWTEIYEDELKRPDIPFEEKSGLGRYTSNFYWNNPSTSTELSHLPSHSPLSLWWTPHLPDVHLLTAPFPDPAIKTGISSTSFSFNPQKHITWLLRRIQQHPATAIQTLPLKLPVSDGLKGAIAAARSAVLDSSIHGAPTAYINATGLGARFLVPDPAVHPIRGQTLLVRGEARGIYTHVMAGAGEGADERIAYVLPRNGTGTSLIGGSKQVGVWETGVDEGLSEEILGWARTLAPELCGGGDGGLEVLKVQVGLRPGRKGGVRVEREVVGDGEVVVHAYGNGGAGFQNSVGCAREVVKLVGEVVAEKGEGV